MTEDQLMRDMLASTSAFVNCTNGVDGDNPTEITRQDIDLVIRSLRNTNAMPFITGIEGENKFGSAPRIACGGIKSLVIDLELLAA